MSIQFKTGSLVLLALLLLQCGGSDGKPGEERLLVKLPPAEADLLLARDDALYVMEIYSDENGDSLGSAAGPVLIMPLNEDEQLYETRVSGLEDGDYILEVRRVEDSVSEAVTLASLRSIVSFYGEEQLLDLSAKNWVYEEYDDDGDGLYNVFEIVLGTDPLAKDSDADGVFDLVDLFPLDESISADLDGDGIGDEKDHDADGDGLKATEEALIGTSDFEADSDGDTIGDNRDNCPVVANADQRNSDSDAMGDDCDDDRDNDGLSNIEERTLGTHPLKWDSDGDSVSDGEDFAPLDRTASADSDHDLWADGYDNCSLEANPSQLDTDLDAQGDDCDLDDDNDGLADLEEESRGADGFLSLRTLSDSDIDGQNDKADNCPLMPNLSQLDGDGDGWGDGCDLDPQDPEVHQLAIFVSTKGTASADQSSPAQPCSDLAIAISQAAEWGYDVYLTEGIYDVSQLTLADGVSLYGGFAANFSSRDRSGKILITRLENHDNEKDHVFFIQNFLTDTVLSGLTLANLSTVPEQKILDLENATMSVKNTVFIGNPQAQSETLLEARDATLELRSSRFYGAANQSTTGLSAFSSQVLLLNNLMAMGNADHTAGLRLTDSSADLLHNTIDGGRHTLGSAYAAILESSQADFTNNILITAGDSAQASVLCQGLLPSNPSSFLNNLFLRYSNSSQNFAAYINCDGGHDTTAASLDLDPEIITQANLVPATVPVVQLSSQVDVSDDYRPVTSVSLALGAGADISSWEILGADLDLFDAPRTLGAPDLGAFEAIE